MSKKTLGLTAFFVIVVAVVGGIFWWTNIRVIEGNVNDYQIKLLGLGNTMIENKKAGLTFSIPTGWKWEKIDELEGSVIIYSPDTEFIETNAMPLKAGCLIEIGTVYKKMDFEKLKKEIDDIHYGLGVKSEEFETITINNTQFLKNIFDTVFMGKGTAVYIPYENRFYSFAAYAGFDDEEQCLKDFDEFLNKVTYE